jgi:hypothetical protein
VVELIRMRWTGHKEHTMKTRNAYDILVGKLQGRDHFRDQR